MEQRQSKKYTVDYVENLPEDVRVELIDGVPYDMASPSTSHQRIVTAILTDINNYIRQNHGECEVFSAPFAVYLDDQNYFEPDISVICDKNKLDEKGYHGAPDWVIEIASPSTCSRDYITKMSKYYEFGTKLYWIINPMTEKVTVWFFAQEEYAIQYSFGEDIPVGIYPGFSLIVSKSRL